MQTPTNNHNASLHQPVFSSSVRETKRSSALPASTIRLLVNAPMIDTPETEKNMRNDLRYLMIADMIDTPESDRNEPLLLDVTYFSTFNFDDHDHMICHQEKTNGNDLFNKKSIMHSIREAKTMKISNTSRTSHSISEAKTMKINNSSRQSREGASMNPTKLFSSSMMKVKKVINWQDKVPISVLFQKKAKRVGGKRHVGRSLVRSDNLHKKIRLAITPTQTIASDEAITLTPHPFKTPKQMNDIHLPPSAVFVSKNMEPVSEIACRSRRTSFPDLAGRSPNVNGNLSLIDLMTIDEVCPDGNINDADKRDCLNEDPLRNDDDNMNKEDGSTEKILHVAFV